MNLKHLRQKRADLLAEASKTFEAAEKEGRGLSESEAKRDDQISEEIAALDADIARAERHANALRSSTSITSPAAQASDKPKFESLGEMLQAVAKQRPDMQIADPRLAILGASGASEGLGADGGFLVENELLGDMLTNVWENGDILSRVRRIPIGAGKNGIRMNGVDERSRANGSRWGGIQTFWTGEAAQITASQPKFKKVQLDLDKLTGLLYATSELLEDQTALQSWIQQAFPEEMTFKAEDAVMNGTGVGMPLGYLNGGAAITVAKEGSQANGTIVSENIVKMWARMPAKNRKNAVWYVNQDVEPQLLLLNSKIKNVAGTENVGGIAVPSVIYTPPGQAADGFGRLMGRPVIPVEYCPTLGTAGDIQFVDPSQYLFIDKPGVKQDVSIHVRFLFDESAFRFTYRANGQPIWEVPITPFKGTNTQSPFIILQTR